ncbi:MAG: ABC transporter permease, partial [Gemmatimonadales bacterium]|nr:ABC transporter permease [Gemmatimonadales bacterium]
QAAAAAAEASVAKTKAPPAESQGDGALDGLLDLRIASILTARYVDLKLADFWGSAILILQAPLIGFFLSLAFDGQSDGDRGFPFVLAMVAVWLGTFSGCREVVKERLIFLRERRAGVSVRAYLLSKVGVLAFVSAIQCLLLLIMVRRTVDFDSSLPLVFLLLLLTTLSANALGLMLSSMVKSQNSLIASVPIVLIPQLIFSDVLLPNPGQLVENIELGMMASWAYDVLHELPKSEPMWGTIALSCVVLVGMQFAMLLASGIFLRAQDE